MNTIVSKSKIILFAILITLFGKSFASGDHVESVSIDEAIAKKAGITTEQVSSGLISEMLTVYGKTVNDPSQISHIRARFAGRVESVKVNIGDQVKIGDVLAFVESNESLKRYPIKSLMDGVVVERHANPGEMALDQVLFTLANFESIWAELQIFPGQLKQVRVGQKVVISAADDSIESTIKHIIPTQNAKPYSIARVLIDNKSHAWTTGLLVSGHVIINQFNAAIVVKNKAIQIVEKKPVVFIKKGKKYEKHPLKLGRTDGEFTEILSGINLGDNYVVENSYIIKADFEKSGASHQH